ncbi:hypothetical protein [Streptococcus suis]|uniref:hypothetical protein n=1 Tax=Streptococcus suis TaxID=1307 RepID=UPI0038B6D580
MKKTNTTTAQEFAVYNTYTGFVLPHTFKTVDEAKEFMDDYKKKNSIKGYEIIHLPTAILQTLESGQLHLSKEIDKAIVRVAVEHPIVAY